MTRKLPEGTPRKKPGPKRVYTERIVAHLTVGLLAKLNEHPDMIGHGRSSIVRAALRDYLKA